ncbi:hypothetical protein N7462_008485 [Penicillium macrosclerotiorum]|uniref:uncharacterized protein n=1 Tax=Penicillium macrosclerotiorum TaxID=303699 RepID=UPI002546E4CC|nr:uncharacterized protein N7462_008485 [Penicillium macrosclerotiorum]KAJ5675588.1 hypothetical protein N7462_008485 [Penicillium macrosclerotiorum]
MSFPWSYSILGLVPGLILTVTVALVVLYTSLTIWRLCLRYPELRDICDIGQLLFWDSKWAWYATAFLFLLNNTFIQGLHCLVGAEYLNTMSNHAICTIAFSFITAMISFMGSLPRTFRALAHLGTFSAFFTFISIVLVVIFSKIEDHPYGWSDKSGDPIVLAVPAEGTTFVTGLSAFLNISFTFIGQITLPSLIAEMAEPRDFWKSVTVVTTAEIILFTIVGAVVYAFIGGQYISSMAIASLGNELYMKISFSFMVPTLIFLGILYASVSARFIFFHLFSATRHVGNHTIAGWASWAGILFVLWILAWVIAEVIPFFSDLLSIMGAVFGSFFGFIFWGMANLHMRKVDHGSIIYNKMGLLGWIDLLFNIAIIIIGLFFLGPGTYVSVASVLESYWGGTVGSAFICASNGLRS